MRFGDACMQSAEGLGLKPFVLAGAGWVDAWVACEAGRPYEPRLYYRSNPTRAIRFYPTVTEAIAMRWEMLVGTAHLGPLPLDDRALGARRLATKLLDAMTLDPPQRRPQDDWGWVPD